MIFKQFVFFVCKELDIDANTDANTEYNILKYYIVSFTSFSNNYQNLNKNLYFSTIIYESVGDHGPWTAYHTVFKNTRYLLRTL